MATPGGGPTTFLPNTARSPEERSIRPAMQRRKVVLPQPLGPTMHRISWLRTSSVSWRNAITAPSRNSLLALRTPTAKSVPATAMHASLSARQCRLGGYPFGAAPAPVKGEACEIAPRSSAVAAPAQGVVLALERIGVADVARVPPDLETGLQLDIARRAPGLLHAEACLLVGRGVFRPALLQGIVCCGFVGDAGFLAAAENDRAAAGRLAARTDLERRDVVGAGRCCEPRGQASGNGHGSDEAGEHGRSL